MPVRCRVRVCLFFLNLFNFTLISVDNICHSQNVSSNRNETLTVTCSHSAESVEFRYAVSNSQRKNFIPFSNSGGIV